jgi:acid phosphatase class B
MYKNSEAIRYKTNQLQYLVQSRFWEKINKTFNFETGSKLSYVNNDYTIKLQDRDDQVIFVTNTNQSNHLVYKNNFIGLRNYQFHWRKFDIQAYVLNTSITMQPL